MRALILASAALACAFAAPATAGPMHRHHHRIAYASGGPGFQGGVLTGPLYNGQDYLGTDPDPNIRSYILRDLTGRYGGR